MKFLSNFEHLRYLLIFCCYRSLFFEYKVDTNGGTGLAIQRREHWTRS